MQRVSIITPSFNQARFLPATLASIREQEYPHIEHLVMDGGSTDGSVVILRAATGLRWVSEPDGGQVDALNKGFRLAQGEILAWLNADDTMNPDCVRLAVETLERTGADLVYGDVELVDERGLVLRESRGIPFDRRVLLYGINYIGQQTVFFRRSLLERAGPLREEFDNAFDYELWLRMARHGRFVYEPRLRAQIRKHPAAKSLAAAERTHSDMARIREEYWRDGGLPRWLRRKPWFAAVNFWCRWRRQRQLRQIPSVPGRKRVLIFGYLPPPQFGPATAYDSLFQSSFAHHFAVSFMNLGLSEAINEVQTFRWRKLIRLCSILWRTVRGLIMCRFDVACYPIAFNRIAFVKDAALLLLLRLFRVPVVLWAHGNNLLAFIEQSPQWLRGVIRATVSNSRAAIVLGERLRFNFDGLLPPDRVVVVPYGLAAPALPRRAPARTTGLTVLFLGNLIPDKGVLTVLEAAAQVCRIRSDVRFQFAGAWWCAGDRRAAEQIIATHQLDSCVEFLGVVQGDRKWEVLRAADLLAFPTYYHPETFGLVLIEALWAGLPVITTARAAIPEIITDGVNGLLVRERDAEDLSEKILALVNNPDQRERMSRENQTKFKRLYTAEAFGERMTEAIEHALAPRGEMTEDQSG